MRIISVDHSNEWSDDERRAADCYSVLRESGLGRADARNWLNFAGAQIDTILPGKVMDWVDWTDFGGPPPQVDGPEPEHASVEAIEAAISAGERAQGTGDSTYVPGVSLHSHPGLGIRQCRCVPGEEPAQVQP